MGPDHLEVTLLNRLVLILLFGLLRLVCRVAFSRGRATALPQPRAPRPLKAKTGADCPVCRAEALAHQIDRPNDSPNNEEYPRLPPPPWYSVRSQRGRKKASRTEGFACHNPACPYYGITDQSRHALVLDGAHGQHERIASKTCAVRPAATSSPSAAKPSCTV